nr:unnamed protein product [Digitaria exilis]
MNGSVGILGKKMVFIYVEQLTSPLKQYIEHHMYVRWLCTALQRCLCRRCRECCLRPSPPPPVGRSPYRPLGRSYCAVSAACRVLEQDRRRRPPSCWSATALPSAYPHAPSSLGMSRRRGGEAPSGSRLPVELLGRAIRTSFPRPPPPAAFVPALPATCRSTFASPPTDHPLPPAVPTPPAGRPAFPNRHRHALLPVKPPPLLPAPLGLHEGHLHVPGVPTVAHASGDAEAGGSGDAQDVEKLLQALSVCGCRRVQPPRCCKADRRGEPDCAGISRFTIHNCVLQSSSHSCNQTLQPRSLVDIFVSLRDRELWLLLRSAPSDLHLLFVCFFYSAKVMIWILVLSKRDNVSICFRAP